MKELEKSVDCDIMKIFLTGGAGYIGSVLTRELVDAGYDVTVYDTFYFGKEALDDVKDRIKIIQGDIKKITEKDLEGQDCVIDLAAMSNDPAGELDPLITESVNYRGRVNVAILSKKVGVKKYIAPSSAGNYGWSEKPVNETSPVAPITTYTISNYKWEQSILPMADKNFCVTVLRQSTVYGVSWRMRFDIIVNDFTLQVFRDKKIIIKGNGMEFRPFVHIKDDCQAFIKVIDAEDNIVNGEIFNVGTIHQSLRIKDVMESVFKTLNLEPSYGFGEHIDKRNYIMDCSKIERILGFKPKYKIEDGVSEIYKSLENGFLKTDDPRNITLKWYKNLMEKGLLK